VAFSIAQGSSLLAIAIQIDLHVQQTTTGLDFTRGRMGPIGVLVTVGMQGPSGASRASAQEYGNRRR
jgi:hypothetical protein